MDYSNDFVIDGTCGKVLTESEWARFEVKHLEPEKKLLEMLKETGFTGTATSSVHEGQLSTLGNLYHVLRADPKICKRIGLSVLPMSTGQDATSSSKPKGKGGSSKIQKKGISAEEIRHRKLMEKYETEREQFMSSWNRTHWETVPTGKNGMPVETLVLDFLQHINGFCGSISKIDKSRVHDLIFGCAKFLEGLKLIDVRSCETNKIEKPNPLLIRDLETKLEELKQLSRFSIMDAAATNPKFLVKTSYDGVLPGMSCTPYESQVRLINALHANKENGLLACLNTLTGEGKTTLIVAIAAIAQAWNRSGSIHHEVIYCSSQKLKTIEIQVGQNAWNALIPFGTAVLEHFPDRPDKVKLRDNYNCRKLGQERVLTIADISSTIKLLARQVEDKVNLPTLQSELSFFRRRIADCEKQIELILTGSVRRIAGITVDQLRDELSALKKDYSKKNAKLERVIKNVNTQYILFFDEPTVDLDAKDSPMIGFLAQIFNLWPKFTILATATAPERVSIPMLESQFLHKFAGASIEFIKSNKVRIGSEISSLEGNVFIPHAVCDTIDKLERVVAKIETDCFLQKCYTPNVVKELFAKLKDLSASRGFSIPEELYFEGYMNKTTNMNQDAICKLAIQYLKLVISVSACSDVPDTIINEFCRFSFTKRGVNFASLASSADQFESQTLIVTLNPVDFFEKHFGSWVSDATRSISKANEFASVLGFDQMMSEVKIAETRWIEATEAIENDKSKTNTKANARDMDGVDHEIRRKARLEALGPKPKLFIPDELVIGSSSYMVARGAISTLSRFAPESVDWENVECSEAQNMALCLGIGLYSRSYSSSYTSLVLSLASKGKLAYLIADDAICYGTNYPIENVIVDDTCLTPDAHSVKTVFQVFARAGRPGKSWRANVFAHDSVLEMIKEFIHNPEFVDIEVQNMNQALDIAVRTELAEREALLATQRAKRAAKDAERYAKLVAIEREKIEAKLQAEREAKETKETEPKSTKWGGGRWSSQNQAQNQAQSYTSGRDFSSLRK